MRLVHPTRLLSMVHIGKVVSLYITVNNAISRNKDTRELTEL
jgi:hypothetical protein